MVYQFMTQNPQMHQTNHKAMEHRFYCYSSSQIHSEAFNTEQMLSLQCKFKTAPSTDLS